jgi:hypothetical protein
MSESISIGHQLEAQLCEEVGELGSGSSKFLCVGHFFRSLDGCLVDWWGWVLWGSRWCLLCDSKLGLKGGYFYFPIGYLGVCICKLLRGLGQASIDFPKALVSFGEGVG